MSNARQLHSNSELVQVLFVEHLGIQDKLVQKEKNGSLKQALQTVSSVSSLVLSSSITVLR